MDVQTNWNKMEEILTKVSDIVAPISEFTDNVSSKSQIIPMAIKRKISLRKRLITKLRQNPTDDLKKRVKNLNIEIKYHFNLNKRMRVRKGIIPGNSRSLWKAINIAKDINSNEIPVRMFEGGVEVEIDQLSDRFAEHFQQKIKNLSANIEINEHVYNGVSKFTTGDKNFMTSENILKAVQSIKLKNSEGHDRIPQRLLIDGISVLLQPLTSLFDNIYISKQIPEQWSLAKIVPIH